jgi:hypothetical protein
MKKKILVIFTNLLIVAILSLQVFTVYATKPVAITASRSRIIPSGSVDARMAGNSDNRFTLVTGVMFSWTGDIVGISTDDAIRFYHNVDLTVPPPQRLPVRVHSVSTFESVTIMGKSGGLTMKLQFIIDEDTYFKGTWVIIGGTGELSSIRGQGKVSGLRGEEVFSGMIHFDP